jgi:hypothetical protein
MPNVRYNTHCPVSNGGIVRPRTKMLAAVWAMAFRDIKEHLDGLAALWRVGRRHAPLPARD